MQPISTRGWTFNELLSKGEHFKPVPRVSCASQDLDKKIHQHEDLGIPLVIEGWHHTSRWPKNIFNMDFCSRYFREGNKKISVRNVHTRLDRTMTFDDFVEKTRTAPTFAEADETERWYGKDVECPQQWEDWLRNERVLPDQVALEGSNDLLAYRPKKDGRPDVETLMCYFGIADTYTPCHKDQCASSGQNLMCYAEENSSSFWFMTKGSDCVQVASYFRALGHELDHETHVVSMSELASAPFDIYVVEQKVGDLVLVPPRSCHQVVNFGRMTIKMSWSRMTLSGLRTALYHELPLYRRVCRPEIYQVKSTIYHTLCHYTQELKATTAQPSDTTQKGVLAKRLATILRLYDHVLFEEFSPYGESLVSAKEGSTSRSRGVSPESETHSTHLAEDFHTCDFCGADIFQSYFQCAGGSTSREGEKGFIVCPGCYVEGRTCLCQVMVQKQRQDFDVLLVARWEALQALKDAGSSLKSFKGSESLKEQKSYFAQPSERSVFHAAMLLYNMRVNQRQTSKSCRVGGDSHPVPSAWALACRKCHSAKCFPHLLEGSRMHSIRALLLQEKDQSHATYHGIHLNKFLTYDQEKDQLLVAQKEGVSYPDFKVHMVYSALTFRICQPVNAAYASLGWYDRLPSKPKHKINPPRLSPQPRPSKSRKLNTHAMEVDESERSDTPLSSTSSSQRSVKNHAYVELKPLKPVRIRADHAGIVSKQLSSSPLSSPGHDDLESSDLKPDARYSNLLKESSPVPVSRHPSTTKETRAAKLEKNNTPTPSDVPHLAKRSHNSHTRPSGDGTVFASVYPIGPPRKKKRQETTAKPKLTTTGGDSRAGGTNDFAAALGAAINQVAATATRTSGSTQENRRKSDSIKKRPANNGIVATASVPGSTIRHHSTSDKPILVNVVELQEMVVRTAEQTVRQIVGETALSPSLTANVAVSMMTGYAAAGQFVNNNSQLQFPSIDHFAGMSPQVSGAMLKRDDPQVEGPNSGVKARDDYQEHLNNGSLHASQTETTGRPDATMSPQRSLSVSTRKPYDAQPGKTEKTSISSTRSPERKRPVGPHLGAVVALDKKRRRIESDDESC